MTTTNSPPASARPITRPISTAPGQPLRNHAISDIYPPGSTFKLVTGLAALEEKVTTPTRRWPTYGCYQIPDAPKGQCLFDWNHAGFGPLDMARPTRSAPTRSSTRWL